MSNEKSSRDLKQFFIPLLVVALVALAFFSGTLWQKVKNLESGGSKTTADSTAQAAQPAQTTVYLSTIKGLFDKDIIKFGDANRKVLIVEMSDPSCPFCHIAAGKNPELSASMDTQTNRFKYASQGGSYVPPVPEIKKLVDDGKASYIYIYMPGHGNGEMGMKALYCANEKGRFWEAHDLLFTNEGYDLLNETIKNDKAKSKELADFLKAVVDPEFLKSCLDSGKYDQRLASDQDVGRSLGFQGTPHFYVNASSFPGAYSYSDMEATIKAALQ